MEYAVQALKWRAYNDPSDGRTTYGFGVFGHWYGVKRVGRNLWSTVHDIEGKSVHLPLQPSLADAKAAAQADYDHRILSVIQPKAGAPTAHEAA